MLNVKLVLIGLWSDFFGPDTFYRAKKSILLSTINFKNKVPIGPFYLEFSLLFEFLKIFKKFKKINELKGFKKIFFKSFKIS